jgi:hypothetical protein
MFGDITLKCRPLRLAFLIPPDKTALRTAIQINSTLWGGTFNPIIPLYARSPKAWKDYPGQKILMKDRVAGYVRAFDPDFLVDCTGSPLPSSVSDLARPVIPISDIWSDFYSSKRDGAPKYGVGVFELLHGIYEEYFKVVRRFPVKVAFPTFPEDHALFWSAAVGELPEVIQEEVEKGFSKAIDIEKPAIGPTQYQSILDTYRFFPRNITRYQLETGGARASHSYAFFMDATKFPDIVDFWNLRALGRPVMPIPKQFAAVPEYVALVGDFLRNQYRVHPMNPAVQYGTNMVRSYSSTMEEMEAFAKTLKPQPFFPEKPEARVLALQHWYPRIWDEWAMGKDNAAPRNVVSSKAEYSFPEVRDTASFDFAKPTFVRETSTSTPRYANEIYPRFYGEGGDLLADVLPYDHGDEVLRAAGGVFHYDRDEFRIGRTGAIHLIKWRKNTRWKLPLAEDVFFAWLKDKGFDAELSTCGRLAKQMHAQLGGWTNVLTSEPLLQLFDTMAKGGDDGKGMSLGEVKNRIGKIGSLNKQLYEMLVERNVFQLGYKTQCRHCGRGSWFSVNDLATELTCPLCFKKIGAINAVDRANKGDWHLKTAGPFSVDKFADGGYSVLLALNFLQHDRSLQTTPVMSFTAKHAKSGAELEADLGVMWQESMYGEDQDGILFAECKSYNEFKDKDFQRMKTMAQQFPGAILAFATLRKKLTPREIKEITKIAKAGMKLWKAERPLNPVLVLTGHELFARFSPPHCWDGLTIPGWAKQAYSLLEVCNATQAIHLGMPLWAETWNAEFEKKRQRKQKKATDAGPGAV